MRSKRRNTNLKILQSQLQHLTTTDEKVKIDEKTSGNGPSVELPIIEKLPKKSIESSNEPSVKNLPRDKDDEIDLLGFIDKREQKKPNHAIKGICGAPILSSILIPLGLQAKLKPSHLISKL